MCIKYPVANNILKYLCCTWNYNAESNKKLESNPFDVYKYSASKYFEKKKSMRVMQYGV